MNEESLVCSVCREVSPTTWDVRKGGAADGEVLAVIEKIDGAGCELYQVSIMQGEHAGLVQFADDFEWATEIAAGFIH